eukprot:4625024-Prymnesium_polylepis.2
MQCVFAVGGGGERMGARALRAVSCARRRSPSVRRHSWRRGRSRICLFVAVAAGRPHERDRAREEAAGKGDPTSERRTREIYGGGTELRGREYDVCMRVDGRNDYGTENAWVSTRVRVAWLFNFCDRGTWALDSSCDNKQTKHFRGCSLLAHNPSVGHRLDAGAALPSALDATNMPRTTKNALSAGSREMPLASAKNALGSADREMPLASEHASSNGVFSIAASRALRLLPTLKAELPGLEVDGTAESLLLSSISALVERNRSKRDDPDALLAAAWHELAKMKYIGNPSSTDADHARSL